MGDAVALVEGVAEVAIAGATFTGDGPATGAVARAVVAARRSESASSEAARKAATRPSSDALTDSSRSATRFSSRCARARSESNARRNIASFDGRESVFELAPSATGDDATPVTSAAAGVVELTAVNMVGIFPLFADRSGGSAEMNGPVEANTAVLGEYIGWCCSVSVCCVDELTRSGLQCHVLSSFLSQESKQSLLSRNTSTPWG